MAESSGIDSAEKETRPKRFFGMKQTEQSNPFLATYDYTHKYPEDARYHELDDDARVWAVYNDEAKIYDTEIVAEAGESLDVILIFAGLFSSVLATFVAQSSQALAPDSAAISVSILRELADIQRAQANGTSVSDVPRVETETSPSPTDIWVNGLWFTSLVVSLSTALIAVLAKQWLRQYLSVISGSQKDRTLIHYFRRTSFDKWRVRGIIGFLPTLLHLALFLFLAGLAVQLSELHRALSFIVLVITAVLGIAYAFALFAPVFDPTCPYQTTLTDALIYPWTFALSSRIIRRIFRWPSVPAWDLPELIKAAAAQPVRNREHSCSTKDTNSQMFCFHPLLWMDHTTSNPSARTIILDAVSAIHEPDTKVAVSKDMHVNQRVLNLLVFHNAFDDLGQAFAEKANILERLFRAIDFMSYGSMFPPVSDITLDIEDTQLVLTALSTQSFGMRLSDKTGSVHTFNVWDDPQSFLSTLLDSFSLDDLPSLPVLVWARFPVRIPGPEDDCTPGFLEFVASYAQHERGNLPIGLMRFNYIRREYNLTIREYLVPLVTAAGWFSEKYRYRLTPLPPDGDGNLLVEPRPLSSDFLLLANIPHPDHSCSIWWNLHRKESRNVDEELYRCMLGDFEISESLPTPVNRTEWTRKARAKLKAWRKGDVGSSDLNLGGGSEGVELSEIV